MLESIKNYPLIWCLTLVLLIAAIVVWRLAMKSRRRSRENRGPEQLLTYQDLEKLKQSFQTLTEEKLRELKGDENLLFAVITNIEYRLDQGEEEDTFASLTAEQQNLYALWYFVHGIGGRQMCDFYHEYGAPLTTLLPDALENIGESKLSKIAAAARDAYDEENEEASADTRTVEALNAAFREEYDKVRYYHAAAEYVKAHMEKFLG